MTLSAGAAEPDRDRRIDVAGGALADRDRRRWRRLCAGPARFPAPVGPRSAGARPGPACYRAGGPPTITDANLLLGRLRPDQFLLYSVRTLTAPRMQWWFGSCSTPCPGAWGDRRSTWLKRRCSWRSNAWPQPFAGSPAPRPGHPRRGSGGLWRRAASTPAAWRTNSGSNPCCSIRWRVFCRPMRGARLRQSLSPATPCRGTAQPRLADDASRADQQVGGASPAAVAAVREDIKMRQRAVPPTCASICVTPVLTNPWPWPGAPVSTVMV